jgi:hypothetical protein
VAITNVIKPDLPGSLIRWVGTSQTRIPPTTNQVVAVLGSHNWGPELADQPNTALGLPGGVDLYQSLADWEGVYGSDSSPLHDAVVSAFAGMNVSGGGGAGGIISPRLTAAAAARAAVTRSNTTPAPAVTFTARWKGTRGNNLSLVIEADPVTAANDRVRVLFNGATVETYSYVRTDIASLVSQVTARSKWLTATQLITGVALSTSTGVALTGGSDGSTLTTAEYAAGQSALEFKDFGLLVPANLTDVPTKVQIATWAAALALNEMRPFRIVLGGTAGETLANVLAELTANAALRDPHIVRFGVGTLHDDILNQDMSTAQLAPRIAGMLAARGERSALTRAEAGGLHYVGATGPSSADLISGRDNGVTMLRRVSHPETELAVSQGVSTFISRTTPGMPYEFFSEPRIVGILDSILRRITQWGDRTIIGDVTVTDDSRREVRKEIGKILDEYEDTGLAQVGTSFVVVLNTDGDPTLSDTIPFQFGFKPARTANFLIGEGRIS